MRDFTVRPDDTLLLLIDLQERMLPSMANSNVVCKNSKVLLEAAKAFEMPVLYTEQYPKGLAPRFLNSKKPWMPFMLSIRIKRRLMPLPLLLRPLLAMPLFPRVKKSS